MRTKLIFGLMLAFASAGLAQMCEPGATLSPEQIDSVAKNFESKYADAFNNGDAKTLGSLYTETATVLAEYGAVQRGRARIEKSLASLLTSAYGTIEDTPILSHAVANDVIVVQGTMVRHAAGDKHVTETVLYTHVLVQRDSEWRLTAVQHSIKAHIPNQSEFLKTFNSKDAKSQ